MVRRNKKISFFVAMILFVNIVLAGLPLSLSTMAAGETTLFSDDFETGNLNNWVNSPSVANINTDSYKVGSYSVRLDKNDAITKSISTAGYDSIVLSYVFNFRGTFAATDHFYVKWTSDGGATWNVLTDYTANTDSAVNSGNISVTTNLPGGAANNADFGIRFESSDYANSNRRGYIDNVVLTGIATAGGPTVTATPSPSPTPPPTGTTFVPSDDAYVKGGNPDSTRNFGSAATLELKRGGLEEFFRKVYVKFDLTSSSISSVSSAKLKLYANPTGSISVTAYETGDSWNESSITYSTAPAFGAAITSSSLTTPAQYYEWDVTRYVNSQLSGDRLVSIALWDGNAVNIGVSFSSKEAGSNAPVLEMVEGPAPTPIPTPSPTPTPAWVVIPGTQTVAFDAIADTYVDKNKTGENYSNYSKLLVEKTATNEKWGFLKFDVNSIGPGTVTSIKLKLHEAYAAAGDTSFKVQKTTVTDWLEKDVKWSNKPALASTEYGSFSGSLTEDQTIEIPLDSSLISGNGIYSIALVPTTGTIASSFYSCEYMATKPQLIVTYTDGTAPIPTPLPTAAPTPIPTPAPIGPVQYVYVDPVNGNDSNSGLAVGSPLKSVVKARDVVRTLNSNMSADIIVYLRGGIYDLSEPTSLLALNNSDSGTNGYNVVWQAYPGETPVLSGGKKITGWSLHDAGKNIYRAYAGSINTRHFYVNGRNAYRARSTEGLPGLTFTSNGHTTAFKDIVGWANKEDIEIIYLKKWRHDRRLISTITEKGDTAEITLRSAPPNVADVDGTYYENAYELLNEQREWYYNKADGYIYYIPDVSAGENLANAECMVGIAENLVTVTGTSFDDYARNIQFKGIEFRYTTWMKPTTDGKYNESQSTHMSMSTPSSTDWPDNAFEAYKAHHIVVEECRFIGLGGGALMMREGCQDNIIRGNVFLYIGGNGIQVGHPAWSDANKTPAANYQPKNYIIDNNLVLHMGQDLIGGTGIWVGYCQNVRITHNEVGYTGYGGISVGWAWWNNELEETYTRDNLIERNYVHHTNQQLKDGGAIYTLGTQPGTVVRRNYVKDITINPEEGVGLYTDQGSEFETWEYNVVDNANQWAWIWMEEDKPGKGYARNNIWQYNYTNTNAAKISNKLNYFYDQGGSLVPFSGEDYGTNVYVTGAWPQEAQTIIGAAGLEPAYKALLGSYIPVEPNTLPMVNAGSDLEMSIMESLELSGSVVYNGNNPSNYRKSEWKVLQGPGGTMETDSFGNTYSTALTCESFQNLNTKITFSKPGSYVIALEAQDGYLKAHDEITVKVVEDSRYNSLVNLAESASVTASSYFNSSVDSTYAPQKAVDGDIATCWTTGGSGRTPPDWFIADLGNAGYIQRLEIVLRQDYNLIASHNKSFEVQASNTADFSSYVVLGSLGNTVMPFKSTWTYNVAEDKSGTAYRYVRFLRTVTSSSAIAELRILGIPEDNTAPAEVRSTAVIPGDRKLTLTWIDPADADFDQVKVKYQPLAVTEAVYSSVYAAKGDQYLSISNLNNGITYTITISTLDTHGNESAGVTLTGVPVVPVVTDTIPPAQVTDVAVTPANSKLLLSWRDPSDVDFQQVKIKYKLQSVTESVYSSVYTQKSIETAELTGLMNGAPYTLVISTIDINGNESTGIILTGTPTAPVSEENNENEQDNSNTGAGQDNSNTSAGQDDSKQPERIPIPKIEGSIIYFPEVKADAKGITAVKVDAASMEKAIGNAKGSGEKEVTINIPGAESASKLIIEIPATSLNAAQAAQIERVTTDARNVIISVIPDALGKNLNAASVVSMTVEAVSKQKLNVEEASIVGDSPVYDFNAFADGKQLNSFDGKNPVMITLGYKLKPGEKSEKVVVYSINESGKLEVVKKSRYDAGKITFTTNHFGRYAILHSAKSFTDTAHVDWAQSSIEALVVREIIGGVGDGKFAPDRNITRAEFIKILISAFGLEVSDAKASFNDIKEGEWYYTYVASAQKLGIVSGYNDGTFGINKQISRQEMATMAYRAIVLAKGNLLNTVKPANFTDKTSIDQYALEAVTSMQQAGIIDGMEDGSFAPADHSTRAQAAKIVYGLFKLLV